MELKEYFVETKGGVFKILGAPASQRPAPGDPGLLFLATDTLQWSKDTGTAWVGAQSDEGSDRWLKLHAGGNLDALITGAITRDSNGAATSAPVVWPDGTPGTYTATVLSPVFSGAVDAYAVTYGSPIRKTVTQPAVTRDAATGAVINRPAMVVS